MTRHTAHPAPGRETLEGKALYIPRMSNDGASMVAAAYRAIGVDGRLLPESDAASLELARQFANGDECYPELVTLGGFLKVTESPGFDPARTAFLMPTASGPCRFGQYQVLLKEILSQKGLDEVTVVSATSADGYEGLGDHAGILTRLVWWGIVCADGLRKLLLQTRPYERTAGDADGAHAECLDLLTEAMARPGLTRKERFAGLVDAMGKIGERFGAVPADYTRDRPLIGVVGEVYCRLDSFTNADLVRRVERLGGEAWLADLAEWGLFVNFMERMNRRAQGQRFSAAMARNLLRERYQKHDEHALLAPLRERFAGTEEACGTEMLAGPAAGYLPYQGAQGEMVLSVGGILHMHSKGADGAIDISPFSCMNGIICEAIYPRVSADLDGMPIRVFYFDGTERDHDGDLEIFLELAHTYRRRKRVARVYPDHFPVG